MSNEIKMYGSIHTHMQSRFDTADNIPRFVGKLADYGAVGFVLTDHGVLTAVDDVRAAVEEINEKRNLNMKFIPGVEAYVEEDDDLFGKKHLILIAIDNIGYSAICRAVTDSNRRLDKYDTPLMNEEILMKHFGPGSKGHGHVFATSACISGVLATPLNGNKLIDDKIERFRNSQKTSDRVLNPASPDYVKIKEKREKLISERDKLTEFKNETKAKADKKYAQREKQVEKLKLLGDESYTDARKELDQEEYETEVAKKAMEKIKNQLSALGKKISALNVELKKVSGKIERYNMLETAIKDLEAKRKSKEDLYAAASSEAVRYRELFGKEYFFIELQNHNMNEERIIMPQLARIARENDIRLIASNDIHTITNSEDDILARQIIRAKRFNRFEAPDVADSELYIKTDEELRFALDRIFPEKDILDEAMNNIKLVIDACGVTFIKEEHYPKYKCEENLTADEQLRKLAYEGIEWRFPGRVGWTEEHQKRLDYELDIMSRMKVSDYHLVVKDFLEYGRIIGKAPADRLDEVPLTIEEAKVWVEENGWDVGEGVGPGRGSAVGSIVCYLIGITGLDPLKYDLLFERYLNIERVSMPKKYWASTVNSITQRCA